ncbi:hypothetical protein Lal_00006311 [Lupinus albus]|uniref:Putative transcription factor MYB-HB-like family n=1 Tax=Lupinus albus TaxID=3870 RepID=A0A6A4Q7G7_LUPAL|nr:putative transcription factor MYB-HB-like family [Lupinus albus]KAF1875681.1 hypothetical protein Lal_00006311 [Lupinus albus]
MGRAPCCDKANVKKGPWSPEEDDALKEYIEKNGTGGNWIALPQKIGIKRCGKSCRLRWLNYLRPNIKHGGFTEDEDNIICSLYISIGSRWSIIAAQLPGRTDNDIKNYWNTRLKKKLLGRRKQSNFNTKETNGIEENSSSNSLSNSALERLQLHMQLQSLQNPFSFYSNYSLWPKLHPSQEKVIQQSLNDSSNSNPLMQGQNDEFYKPITVIGDLLQQNGANINAPKVIGHLENTLNNSSVPFIANSGNNTPMYSSSIVEQTTNMGLQQACTLQITELDDILNNRTTMGSYLPQEEQNMAEFDCFREMNGSKDNSSLIWWSNVSDAKSATTSSWDSSTTPALMPEGMFQDYELGYSL